MNPAFTTVTLVVRTPYNWEVVSPDFDDVVAAINGESVCFFSTELGVAAHAVEAGAEPSSWDEFEPAPTPLSRYQQILDDYNADEFDGGVLFHESIDMTDEFPVCLVETNDRTDQTWITLHESTGRALTYHDGQEYAEDWDIDLLVDLRTGITYDTVTEPRTTITKENI